MNIIGMTKEEALSTLDQAKAKYFIVEEEGERRVTIANHNPARYRLVILGGKVASFTMG